MVTCGLYIKTEGSPKIIIMKTLHLLPSLLLGICFFFCGLPCSNAQTIDTESETAVDTLTTTTVESKIKGFVVFKKDSLFTIHATLGPYSPKERAYALNEKLKEIASGSKIEPDSFALTGTEKYHILSYLGKPLYYVSDTDAQAFPGDISREELAGQYLNILKKNFTNLIESRKASFWLSKIGFTLLSLLGLILILVLINRAFIWLNKRLERYEQGIKRKRKSILRYLLPRDTNHAFTILARILRIGLIIVFLIIYLPFLFSFLPWTEGLADKFYALLAKPVKDALNALANFLPNLLYIFIILVVARYVIRIVTFISKEIEEENLKIKGFHKDWAKPTFTILKIILYAFTLVIIFPYLPGSDSPAFKGVSIFLGVLFSFGSTSAISNIVAGIVITYMRPFLVGDRVRIGESTGDVVERNLLVTRIKTIKNEDITIPNATIINSHIWNYTKYANSIGIILHPTVTIGYDVPSELVTKLLLRAAKNTKNLTRDFKPFVLQKSLNDFYVEYELNVYTRQPQKMAQFYSELNKTILDEFNKEGVEILSPHYSAFRDGNSSTIPGDPAVKEEPPPPENPVEIIDKVKGK